MIKTTFVVCKFHLVLYERFVNKNRNMVSNFFLTWQPMVPTSLYIHRWKICATPVWREFREQRIPYLVIKMLVADVSGRD